MNKDNVVVNILIPTYNNLDTIDATIQSIYNQTFPQEKIYVTIVDRDSEDGTYEKVLGYDRKHLGIYRLDKPEGSRTVLSEDAKVWQRATSEYSYIFILRPGDIIYPEFLNVCVETMISNVSKNPLMMFCETDVRKKDGSIVHQTPLFKEEKIIDGLKESVLYVDGGYTHNIVAFGGTLPAENNRAAGEVNERIWWNKCLRANMRRNSIYIPNVLACIQEREYDDELEEILLRWEAIIGMLRAEKSKYENTECDDLQTIAFKNLSHYSLWRSFLLHKKGLYKEAEDCYIISRVIYNKITETDIYEIMTEIIVNRDNSKSMKLEELFKED